MQPHSSVFTEDLPPPWTSPRVRGSPLLRDLVPVDGTYLDDVSAVPDARRAAYANFVRRALTHAKATRRWSIPKIAEVSGVGQSTIYRWRDGDWTRSPGGDQVAAFCAALDIPASSAFSILWPNKDERPVDSTPLPTDPDLELLARRLADPAVPEQEKFLIREVISGLAARSARPKRDVG